MRPAFSAICPTCKGNINDADRACGQCGADVSVWPGVGRTPLILPGNPALSDDEVRRRISPFRMVGGTVLGAAALLGALYLTSASEPDEPALVYATGTTGSEPALADSVPATLVTLPAADSARMLSAVSASASAPRSTAPASTDATVEPALEPIPAFVVAPSEVAAVVSPSATAMASAARIETPKPPSPPPARTPVRTPPVTLRSATPEGPALPAAARRAVVAIARPALPAPSSTPVLKVTPLVSDLLRPGELLQLRWSVQDRATGRAVKADMEFTSTDASVASVDRRTGTVSARKPGRVRIIVDAGAAGETAIALTIQPRAMVEVVLAAPTETLQARTEAARSVSVIADPPAPVLSSPVPAPTPPPVREARRDDVPTETDVRTAIDRVVSDIRRSGASNAQIMGFLADGDGHRVAMLGTPTSSGAGNNALRVSFEVRLTKFDGGGRPVARVVPVSFTIDKRDSAVTSSGISIGALRR